MKRKSVALRVDEMKSLTAFLATRKYTQFSICFDAIINVYVCAMQVHHTREVI